MYTSILLCAVFVAANAQQQFWPGFGGSAGANYGQAGFGNGVNQAQAAAAQNGGAQGAQASQGAMNYGQGMQHADAQQAAGTFDHGSSLLAASERSSAGADQSAGDFDTAFSFGGAQGSQGSQGAQAGAGQFGQAQGAAANQAGQVGGLQGQANTGYGFAPFAARPVAGFGNFGGVGFNRGVAVGNNFGVF